MLADVFTELWLSVVFFLRVNPIKGPLLARISQTNYNYLILPVEHKGMRLDTRLLWFEDCCLRTLLDVVFLCISGR